MFPSKFTRYILWDVLKLFGLSLTAMTSLISLVFVGQQLVASDLSYLSVAKLMPYLFLMGLQYSVPPTILFSVCCVYGRISADNEIIALKSGGISPMCIFRPAIVLGFLLSVPSVWINDMAVSWAKPTIERVILRSLEEIIYKGLSSKKAYNSEKGFAIHVQDVKDRWLIKPNIWMQSDNQLTTIIAERAKISIDPEKDKMIIELVDSLVVLLDGSGQKEIRTPGSEPFEMPLNLANKNGATSVRPAHYSIGQIPAELARQNGLNDRRREKLATRQAIALASGRYVSLNDDAARLIAAEMSNTDNRLARLKTEPMRRWSQGFSCLAFVWIGVPMAVLIRSADYWWTFGVCFVPILLIYYPIFGLTLEFSKDGTWPAATLWLSNITLILIGTWQMRKVIRT
ncbi:MAG: LptF/LptG family permease [Planctomycetota bacterium]|nr:LptF/LptG family permease [Planctomycetota bacterium]